MDCAYITSALVHGLSARFPYRRYLVVPNVSWGFLNWEADLIAVSGSDWMTEVEIKCSVSDLRRDLDKDKFKPRQMFSGKMTPTPGTSVYIREFWYAMPVAVWDKVCAAPPIPEYAGVIAIDPSRALGREWKVVRPAAKNKTARKITEAEKLELMRLCMIKFWAHKPVRDRKAPEPPPTEQKE